jgi:hypothetical protein
MTFIETVPEDAATGATADWYAAERERVGYLPNYTRAFGRRPDVYGAWKQLGGAIGDSMDPRRYELATLAAARVLRSSYCTLAHGKVLAERFLGPETTRALAEGEADTVLDPVDAEIVRFATQVARGMRPPSPPRTSTACGPSACQTATSSTLPWQRPPAASSAPWSRPLASSPTPPTATSTRSCARP